MKIPDQFVFSQNNLQDFFDCEYRFLLRHIQHLEWPAIESEPQLLQEEKIETGYQFHRLIQQYFSGIEPEVLTSSIQNSVLQNWWNSFLGMELHKFPGIKLAEKSITVPFNNFRLTAKYDLLVLQEKGIMIFDWKTSTIQPSRRYVLTRMQSRVYPALLVLQRDLPSPIFFNTYSDIEMSYWYPEFADSPVSFCYSESQFLEDTAMLNGLIDKIQTKPEADFKKTEDQKKCKFCRYRSLCDRGISAGTAGDDSDDLLVEDPFAIDFDAL
jgi:hypothetical protein